MTNRIKAIPMSWALKSILPEWSLVTVPCRDFLSSVSVLPSITRVSCVSASPRWIRWSQQIKWLPQTKPSKLRPCAITSVVPSCSHQPPATSLENSSGIYSLGHSFVLVIVVFNSWCHLFLLFMHLLFYVLMRYWWKRYLIQVWSLLVDPCDHYVSLFLCFLLCKKTLTLFKGR